MNEEELEKTKPIATLKDIIPASEEVKKESRTQKNADIVEKQIEKEKEEEAEEALAEKNIALAETLLAEEKEKKDTVETVPRKEKKKPFAKLKEKWNKLSKKQKILIICGIIVLLALIVVAIVLILTPGKDEEEIPATIPILEEAPVLADNFYYKDGSLYFLDEDENELGTYECENKSADLCYVGFNSNSDTFDVTILLDENGNVKEQRHPIFDNNYAFIIDNKDVEDKTVKIYSIKDSAVIDEYNDIKTYDDNYAIVNKDNKYGLIRVEDGIDILIKPQYTYLGMINGKNNLIAKDSKGYKVISKANKVLSSNYNSGYEIKNYSNDFVVLKIADDYTVYNYENDLIASDYDYITVEDDHILLVKNKSLYIRNKDNLKLNEGNIKLKNTDYVITHVYDADNALVETRVSFDINVTSSKDVDVYVYEDFETEPQLTTVKLVEALANQKYDYVNYFDKNLYFYSDLEKEDLLGSYECGIANEISKAEDEYTSCFIATDTIYEDNDMMSTADATRKSRVPIINNRYAFISDGYNNIALYDFVKKGSPIATYTTVNSYTSNNDNAITMYTGRINIVALNKKGKYGMITIDGESVNTSYVFNYNKMERIGDYILVLDTTNKWKILSDNGETVGFDTKIRGYNGGLSYFKVVSDGKYTVYDSDGVQVSDETYTYVELYNDFYAAVNSNLELNIYDYNGNLLTNDGIKIGNYSYYKTENPAFKVRKSGDSYIVLIFDGTTYTEIVANTSNNIDDNNDSDEDLELEP